MTTYLNTLFSSLKRWPQESIYHLNSARSPNHSLKDRAIHFGFALTLSIPLIRTISKIFFKSLYQLYTLQAKLDDWLYKRTLCIRNRLSVSAKILECYRQKQLELDLSSRFTEDLPDVFNLFTQLRKLDLSHSRLDVLQTRRLKYIRNLTQLEELKLSHNQLTELSESIVSFTQLRRLDLSKNHLTKLPESIGNLTQLEELDLSKNHLTKLPESIGNLTRLPRLHLSDNQLTELPTSIGNLTRLPKLYLSRNRITKLPTSIGNLTQLEELDLSDNQLTELPTSIGNLTRLPKLYLSRNRITKLPTSIGNLTQLEELDLSDNQLTELPTSIGNLTRLPKLSLSRNRITKLPTSIGNLTRLQELDLSRNRIIKLPTSIGNLTRLQELDLSDNQLTELPTSIRNLTRLEKLDLSDNQLTELPTSIGNLTRLPKLYLSRNRITKLPTSIGNLTRLQELDLSGNRITELPESIGNLTRLQELYLSDNQLIELPESIGNLTRLPKLYLSRNRITKLPESIGNLTQLKWLYLSDNQLIEIPESIGNLTQLKWLNLSHNQITHLPASFFRLICRRCHLENNRFSPTLVNRIRQRVGTRFNVYVSVYEGRRSLKHSFEACIFQLKEDAKSQKKEVFSFEDGEKYFFQTFFNALENSLVYKGANQTITAQFLLYCLRKSLSHQGFRGVFFAILQEASTSCGDRVSFYMNSLHFQYYLSELSSESSDSEVARFIIGFIRIRLLRMEAKTFIQDYKGVIDDIEVYLALQVKLKETLDLPLYEGVDHMLYFCFSGLTEEKIEEIKNRVESQTKNKLKLLAQSEIWQRHLEEKYKKEYLSINSQYIPPNPIDEESDQDYQNKLDRVTHQRVLALDSFYKRKALRALEIR